jgi:predicted PurR-regulated permease PerM
MSYAVLSVVCFVEIVVGFYVMGVEDAWFLAFLIAIFDVLPILGSGGILVPWSIIGFLTGNSVIGFGMLLLWGIIVVVRQVLEPRIVGSQIGLHPLITVMALFIGLKTMGGLGLLMGPLYVIVCKKMNEEGIINLYKAE